MNFIILECIINSRAPLQNFVEKNPFILILSCLEHILDNDMFNIPTCTLLALYCKVCKNFLNFFCQHKLLGFVDQCVFSNVYDFFLHKIRS